MVNLFSAAKTFIGGKILEITIIFLIAVIVVLGYFYKEEKNENKTLTEGNQKIQSKLDTCMVLNSLQKSIIKQNESNIADNETKFQDKMKEKPKFKTTYVYSIDRNVGAEDVNLSECKAIGDLIDQYTSANIERKQNEK